MQQPPTQNSGGQNSGGATDELRSDAKQLGSTAKDRIHSEVDARKSDAAEQAKSVSSAMQRASGELDNAPSWLKSAFQQSADQVQRFAETLENKDSRQLVGDVQNFARQRPGTFLAACAAAGFAAARIFKAGGEQERGGSPAYDNQRNSVSDQQFGQQSGTQGSGWTPPSGQSSADEPLFRGDSTGSTAGAPNRGEFAR